MSSDGLTMREVFNKLMEVQAQNSKIQQETANAIKDLAKEVNTYNQVNQHQIGDLVKSKLWYVVAACLTIAAGAIGIRLAFP